MGERGGRGKREGVGEEGGDNKWREDQGKVEIDGGTEEEEKEQQVGCRCRSVSAWSSPLLPQELCDRALPVDAVIRFEANTTPYLARIDTESEV